MLRSLLPTRLYLIFPMILSTAVILLSCLGGILPLLPVPFWDMWDGTLGSYMDLTSGKLDALFAQHQ